VARVSAVDNWRQSLESLALPPELVASAPESPWGFAVSLFDRLADDAMTAQTASRRAAATMLADGGAVLDVGCGGGAASLPLVPLARHVVGVDESAAMLEAFAARADRLGVAHREVAGRWPDVAESAPAVDVAVCHHVLYNVAGLPPFVRALTAAASRGVVVELTAAHPLAWMVPLWRRLHGLERPQGPTIDDLLPALGELGVQPRVTRWSQPSPWQDAAGDVVAFVRRRLCLPASRDDDVRTALGAEGVPVTREMVTLAWRAAPRTPTAG
jgi:SAM-dependent methyltransferase